MEFHISRAIREKLDFEGLLFSYTGNVVFADVAASRRLANRMNEIRTGNADASTVVNAGALFGMGLIDELNHALIALYRKEIDPEVLRDALAYFASSVGPMNVDRLLLAFVQQFPNVAVYQGKVTAAEWLAGVTEGLSNREAALEELMLLWLTNLNPAFASFKELFDDSTLEKTTPYQHLKAALPAYLETRPPLSPEIGSLFEALRAPMVASPDSLSGQLAYIREHWPKLLGPGVSRVLLAIDVLREEDVAIWMRFNPPAPDRFGHAAPGFGGEGFIGDEYIGFDQEFGVEYYVGADGVRHRRYAHGYQAPLNEYEAFSADLAWMPNVVLIAKSTYVWLEQLSQKYGRYIQYLSDIPDEELRLLAERGITGLWLIGLWERSIASRTIKRLRGHADAVASAYSLKDYNIAEDLGGSLAYADLRDRASRFGLRLASDMVPNHMGIDSTWVIEHPDWFLSKPESPFPSYSFNGPDISPDSRVEIKIEDHYYDQTDAAVVFRLRHHHDGRTRFVYHGNDGTSFAWNDTAQLDYSQKQVREDVIQTILHVARQFPIIRFDAAMVLAKRHVQRLWFPLPGAGGSIPSRAEDAISQEAFDALMPHEFWREVVDRVAVEVPGTLLLAEAFWLLEGYFVRTLGMHRVYNSAFMNMLRDEENAKYRSYLKKTIEFDPDILKRYVNFMSNPDERTAIDQFGDGDKYFGVCILLSTLPGLPMFAHGQIEGFTERYGMEFKQAKMKEFPNEGLMARHQRDIAPLLKNRQLFAESTDFVLYDFWTAHGDVDENVFAYSNRRHGQRALIFYNNRYGNTRGTVHTSSAFMDKESGELRQVSLSDGLGLSAECASVMAYRDVVTGLEYLRRTSDLMHHGLSLELRGYQSVVLLSWRELRSTAEQPWDTLCDQLAGRGVYSVDEQLTKLRYGAVHDALRHVVVAAQAAGLAEASRDLHRAARAVNESALTEPAIAEASDAEPAAEQAAEPAAEPAAKPAGHPDVIEPAVAKIDPVTELFVDEAYVGEAGDDDATSQVESDLSMTEIVKRDDAGLAVHPGLQRLIDSATGFCELVLEYLPSDLVAKGVDSSSIHKLSSDDEHAEQPSHGAAYSKSLVALANAALRLPQLKHVFDALPLPVVDLMIPSDSSKQIPKEVSSSGWDPVRARDERAWISVFSSLVLLALPVGKSHTAVFDELRLRNALAESLTGAGFDHDSSWRVAARIRLLLRHADQPKFKVESKEFWADPDVRWLAGVNESEGVAYFNKEQFEELLCWLEIPRLLQIASSSSFDQVQSHAVTSEVADASKRAREAGYRLSAYIGEEGSKESEDVAAAKDASEEIEDPAREAKHEEAKTLTQPVAKA
jgi:glycosidase